MPADCSDHFIRGMAKRMGEMACVVMSAVDDEVEDAEMLFRKIGDGMPETTATTTASNPAPVTDDLTADFCRINSLLDLMRQNVREMNNSDFNAIEALVPAVQSEVDRVWIKVEKFAPC